MILEILMEDFGKVNLVQQLILEENSWKYLGLKRELNWQNRY